MVTVNAEKMSRKRKNDEVESSTELNEEKDISLKSADLSSKKQKVSKKRKRNELDNSLSNEDSTQVDSKSKEQKSKQKHKEDKASKLTPSKKVNDEEEEEKSQPSEKKKKKKRNKENVSTFGSVDIKLLTDSGGDIGRDDESEPEVKSRINKAVEYLYLWKNDRKSWKFNKNYQTSLIKAIYNPVIINEEDFSTLLLYLEDCKGNARDKLKEKAMDLIKEDDYLADPVDPDQEKRAREILQMLG